MMLTKFSQRAVCKQTTTPSSRSLPCAARKQRGARVASLPEVKSIVSEDVITSEDRTKLDTLLERFKMFDVDGNGKIDRNELRMLLESVDGGTTVLFTQHWLPEEDLDRVMEIYDKDNNGVIDFEEFQSIVYDGLLLDGMLHEYEDAFNAVDASGNGTIGAMELRQLFKNLGQEISFEKLNDIMEKYDNDHSGQIEFYEFLRMFRNELLDLREVQSYMASAPAASRSQSVLDHAEGDISLIFSREELDEVLNRPDKFTVVFSAMTWCRPCKAMQRPAHKLAQHYKDAFTFVKLFGNSNDQTKEIMKDFLKVRSTPSFMVFKGQELVATHTGKNTAKLEDVLRGLLPEDQQPVGRLYHHEQ